MELTLLEIDCQPRPIALAIVSSKSCVQIEENFCIIAVQVTTIKISSCMGTVTEIRRTSQRFSPYRSGGHRIPERGVAPRNTAEGARDCVIAVSLKAINHTTISKSKTKIIKRFRDQFNEIANH
jgi:hypothetical protein